MQEIFTPFEIAFFVWMVGGVVVIVVCTTKERLPFVTAPLWIVIGMFAVAFIGSHYG